MSPVIASDQLLTRARVLVENLQDRSLMLATAESCTGGLLSALVTEIPGSSNVLERGFVTYSNAAKTEMLDVPAALIETHGAVSTEVARAMAEGAINNSHAQISLSITGIAGPGGGSDAKPVGLVHFGAGRKLPDDNATHIIHAERRFGDIGRDSVRAASLATAFDLIDELLSSID